MTVLKKLLAIGFVSASVFGCQTTELAPATNDTSSQKAQNYLTRDVRDDVFYFVMPDRFNNGDPSNDNGSDTYAISRGGLDVESKWAFHGGDIRGLEQKLDYLQGMGITAIWMTPILRNKAVQKDGFGHHGYWTVDFTQLDSHFGSNADLKSLIDTAHERGIKVFFDIITNHTADVIKFRECHDESGKYLPGLKGCEYKSLEQIENGDTYTPFLPADSVGQKYPEWLNDPQYYHNQGDTTFKGESSLYGDFAGLDDLNTEDSRVVTGMIDIYKNLITQFKPDGFRIDTVKHVQLPFWQQFGPAIVEHAKAEGIPQFHIFGEVYDFEPKNLSRFTTEGKLPSVLDFAFQQTAANVFYREGDTSKIAKLFAQDSFYQDEDSDASMLMTFLGNHDMGRTGYFLNQAAAERENGMSADEKLQRSILSHAFMYFSRGIPVVYYGDEQGFTGDGNDVDARENMFPSKVASYNDNELLGSDVSTAVDNFDTTHPIYKALKQFADVRASEVALRRGDFKPLHFPEASSSFAFARVDGGSGEQVVAIFNPSNKAEKLALADLKVVSSGQKLIAGDATLSKTQVSLPALSFALIKLR